MRSDAEIALGKDFDRVYRFLKIWRDEQGYSDDDALVAELEHMVGKKKLQACFLCDQVRSLTHFDSKIDRHFFNIFYCNAQ